MFSCRLPRYLWVYVVSVRNGLVVRGRPRRVWPCGDIFYRDSPLVDCTPLVDCAPLVDCTLRRSTRGESLSVAYRPPLHTHTCDLHALVYSGTRF